MNFFLASPRCSASTVFICRYFFLEELWELRSLEKEYSQDCILRLFTKLSASGFVCFFSPRGEGNKYVCVCVCVCVSKFCHSSMAYGNNNTQLKSTIYLYSFTHTHVQNVQILIFKEESIIHFRSSEEIFFSKVNFLFRLIQCLSQPRVTAVARKRPRSFCQKSRWQDTPKHAHTLDATWLE